jgi:hypothetical protein
MALTVLDFVFLLTHLINVNQILTQKWFLLQNIKEKIHLTFVIVFSITKNGHTALLSV